MNATATAEAPTVESAAAAVRIRGLTKVYGDVRALDGVDLDVPRGSVFGFLGPNGAGKTTTLRIVTGLARATSGEASVLGRPVTAPETRAAIGFLPDVPGFYPWMTGEEYLRFAGGLFGLAGDALKERVAALLDLAGLADVKTRVGGFSRGMKQRLGVAQALVNAPELLLLDEPTSALDPLGRKDVLDMIVELKGRTTVFFSTHILADVERVCDMVAILDHGRVVAQAPVRELRERHSAHKLILHLDRDEDTFAEKLRSRDWVAVVERGSDGGLYVTVSELEIAQREIPALIAESGLGLRRLESGEVGLEEVFVDLIGGGRR